MTASLEGVVSAVFILFCRIGACIMTMPGFSSQRIPVRVRLYIAVGITLALTPPLMDVVKPAVGDASFPALGLLLVTETLIGMLIGLLARLFFHALETLGTAAAMAMGLGNVLGPPVDEPEPIPAMASFVMLAATTLIFVTDQHWEIIRGLFASYAAIPVSGPPPANFLLSEYLKVFEEAFYLALRISSPLLLFGLITNVAFGFLNKMAPQIPVYFVSGPLLMILATYWFYVMSEDFFSAFSMQFGSWLLSG